MLRRPVLLIVPVSVVQLIVTEIILPDCPVPLMVMLPVVKTCPLVGERITGGTTVQSF